VNDSIDNIGEGFFLDEEKYDVENVPKEGYHILAHVSSGVEGHIARFCTQGIYAITDLAARYPLGANLESLWERVMTAQAMEPMHMMFMAMRKANLRCHFASTPDNSRLAALDNMMLRGNRGKLNEWELHNMHGNE